MIRLEASGPAIDEATLEVIDEIAAAAAVEVSRLLPALDNDIVLGVTPSTLVIPETGETGASVAPGRIEWRADPQRPGGLAGIARRELRFTLFHELHHQVRGWVMRGGHPKTAFIEGPVSEGLATVFERDFAGRRAPWADYPSDAASWVEELLTLPVTAAYQQWMFQHPDGRRWVGYRAGTYIADRAVHASGLSVADLVRTPTSRILQLAGYDWRAG